MEDSASGIINPSVFSKSWRLIDRDERPYAQLHLYQDEGNGCRTAAFITQRELAQFERAAMHWLAMANVGSILEPYLLHRGKTWHCVLTEWPAESLGATLASPAAATMIRGSETAIARIGMSLISALSAARELDPSFRYLRLTPSEILLVGESVRLIAPWVSLLGPSVRSESPSVVSFVPLPKGEYLKSLGPLEWVSRYAAPEVLLCPPLESWRSDQFSVGAILYELLSDSGFEKLEVPGYAEREVDDARTLLGRVALRMCAPWPDDRYESWEEVCVALRAAVPEADRPAADRTYSPAELTRRRIGALASRGETSEALNLLLEMHREDPWETAVRGAARDLSYFSETDPSQRLLHSDLRRGSRIVLPALGLFLLSGIFFKLLHWAEALIALTLVWIFSLQAYRDMRRKAIITAVPFPTISAAFLVGTLFWIAGPSGYSHDLVDSILGAGLVFIVLLFVSDLFDRFTKRQAFTMRECSLAAVAGLLAGFRGIAIATLAVSLRLIFFAIDAAECFQSGRYRWKQGRVVARSTEPLRTMPFAALLAAATIIIVLW